MKRILALLLTLALALCACGKRGEAAADPEAAPLTQEEKLGWSLAFRSPPEGIATLGDVCTGGTDLYLTGLGPDGRPVIGRYDGESFSSYPIPEDIEDLGPCFPTDEGGLGALADWKRLEDPSNNAAVPTDIPTKLLFYGGEGQLLSQQDLSSVMEELSTLGRYTYPDGAVFHFEVNTAAWLDGSLCLIGDRGLFVLDSALHIQNQFPDMGNIESVLPSPQGLLLLVYEYVGSENFMALRRLNSPGSAELETLFRCSFDRLGGRQIDGVGCTPQGEPLLVTNRDICPLASSDSLGEPLFSFYEAGLSNKWAGHPLLPWSEGYVLADTDSELICLEYGPLPDKTPLTMWINGGSLGILSDYLERYNMSDSPWLVRTSYVEEQEAATEMAAGRGPDLFIYGSGGFLGWSDSAVFEELSPYLAAEGLSRADFLPSLMEAVNPGEEIYSIPLRFILALFVQNTALQPDPAAPFSASYALPKVQAEEARVFPESSYTGWLDLFPAGFTRDSLFDWLATVYMGTHLDAANGSCDFESIDYVNLLESCAAFQESCAPEGVPSVYRYLNTDSLGSAGYGRTFFGDDYRFVNAMGSLFSLSTVLAVSSGSEHKDGAWDFVRYCLSSPLGTSQAQISTLNAAREQQLKLLASGKAEFAKDATPADAEQFRELLENTHAVAGQHPELLAILREEAQRFFAGQVTAQEAASASQSRAALYMAERFG